MARRRGGQGIGGRVSAAWGRLRGAGAAPLAIHPPEPRSAGDPEAGRRILAGEPLPGLDLAGRLPWDLEGLDPARLRLLHGAAWLADLAALGDAPARALAQAWVAAWIRRFGAGRERGQELRRDPGRDLAWAPGPTADRLLAWTFHARFLLRGLEERDRASFVAALARHARHLERWLPEPGGRDRVAALAALVHAGLALPDLRRLALRAGAAVGPAAEAAVAEDVLPSRSPEALLDLLHLLVAVEAALGEAGLPVPPGLPATLARGAATLRALRQADGGLPRFHGGGAGTPGRLDEVLAAAGRPARGALPGPAMGFLRLAAGRSTVVVDAAPPPRAPDAQASTLAFEMTSGRRPLVVALGPPRAFGPDWAAEARLTRAQSTLDLADLPSWRGGDAGPTRVLAEPASSGASSGASPGASPGDAPGAFPGEGLRHELAHDGWRLSHGLTHARTLQLSADGRALWGEDLLAAVTGADGARLDAVLDASRSLGLPFAIRFHLHPDVSAALVGPDGAPREEADPELGPDPGLGHEPAAARLWLPSGEVWDLAHDGGRDGRVRLRIEPSAHLDPLEPFARRSAQVVLAGRVLSGMTRVRWRLATARGSPGGLRDLAPGRGVAGWSGDEGSP